MVLLPAGPASYGYLLASPPVFDRPPPEDWTNTVQSTLYMLKRLPLKGFSVDIGLPGETLDEDSMLGFFVGIHFHLRGQGLGT
jgi:hypothetical protein